METENGLVLPGKRRARFGRYRNGKPRKPKRKKTRGKKPKVKPVKLPRKEKAVYRLTVSLSAECFASIRLVRNKSAYVQAAIMRDIQRIYEKHGKQWVRWPD